jgi:hypothetical protein
MFLREKIFFRRITPVLQFIYVILPLDNNRGMETITINVLPEIAESFKKADERDKYRVELYINTWLNGIFGKKLPDERLLDIMKKSSAEAKKNGFNPAMLEEILQDDKV